MRCCLFARLLLPSLILCAATVALWVRSYTEADFVILWDRGGRCGYVCIVRGEVRLVNEPTWSSSPHRYFSQPSESVGYLAMKAYRRDVTFPLWLILPAIVIWLVWAFRRDAARSRPGVCPVCGYDLRATPNRCPECGNIPYFDRSPRYPSIS